MTSRKPIQGERKAGQRKLSQLETLRCYETFRDFRKYMYRAIDKMPRWIKTSEGRECIVSIKRCIRYLARVARSYDKQVKITYLEFFLDEWEVIFDSIGFFFEVKGITKHQRDVMLEKRCDIEEQVAAFRVWLDGNQPTLAGNPKDESKGDIIPARSQEGGAL